MAAWEGSPGMDSREEVRRAWKDFLDAKQNGTFQGTWEEWMPLWIKGNLASAQGGMEPMSAAQGGRAGFKRGRVVEPGGYGGEWTDDDFSWAEPSSNDSGGGNVGGDYEAEQEGTPYEDNPPAPVTYTQTGGDASVAEEFYRQNPEMNPSYNVLDYEDPDYNLAYEVNTGLKQEIFDK